MEDAIIIRPITEDDKKGLVELYDRVWPDTAGTKWGKTSWAVDTSEYKGICAEKDGIIIGSRFAFHSNIYLGRDKLTCVQFGDSCVDAKYRRLGLFSRMNLAFLDVFFQTGNELIYNISVEASKKAYQKVGWHYLEAMSGLLYTPCFAKLLWKIKGNIKLIGGNVMYEKAPIPDVSVISNALLEKREALYADARLIHTKYDKETLQWRVATDSGIRIFHDDTLGACLYKVGKKHGLSCLSIGESFPIEYNQKAFNALLKAVMLHTKPDLVNTSITLSNPLYPYYRSYGFIHNPKKKFINLGTRVNSEIMRVVAYNPMNWGLGSLDVDTF